MDTAAEIDEFNRQIESIVFHSNENGYTVLRVQPKNQSVITAVGSIVSPVVGEMIARKGEWTQHQKFGRQLKFSTFRILRPVTVEGIEKYLGSGIIKGIGPLMAKRLVKALGSETFDIIDNNPRINVIPH